ncbi:MAG TPA: RluA family pseudouridine synthase [Bacteroidales bacterium]|nr:MAG: Ribosomal large subunit pseudouridine synthase A [Bacteroidetes bacterium ADurb.Bin217]HPM12802.1 RluA family pseudouridine synthase [Bacteroidales bacterium]
MQDSCFFTFNEPIDTNELPQQFTYPFYYTPHKLCIQALKQLQQFILAYPHWNHDFGIDHIVEGSNVGKMFGVLVVQNTANELGFLAAFSGKVGESQVHPHFVPPISNIMESGSFYRKGEDELKLINDTIYSIQQSDEYLQSVEIYKTVCSESETELGEYKQKIAANKLYRKSLRESISHTNNEPQLLQQLAKQSSDEHFAYKQLLTQCNKKIQDALARVQLFTKQIDELKLLRKQKSALLQQHIFDTYIFRNARGETANVRDIFATTEFGIPPAGAGDCAAPKLLQYAYTHNYTPIAMAEFWWGQSPKSEIRKHMHTYPSCKTKCEPILGFMLQGLDVEPNPITQKLAKHKVPEIVFEDDAILVVNKPADMLSVPGKIEAESVYSYFQAQYSMPLHMAHRLDMSTSGILIIAKTFDVYTNLQQQFSLRTVHKQYVAIVEGVVTQDSGTIRLPLRVDLDNRPSQMVCFAHGKPAITTWKVVERMQNVTRLHLYPHTGRTHQLRVHCAHSQGLNCAIRGDELYGTPADRLYLHAEHIRFEHPITKEHMSFRVECDF